MKTISHIIVLALVLIIFTIPASAQERNRTNSDFPILKGPYLGQKPPGMIPVMFAPGIVSSGVHDKDITFTPAGDEIFFTRSGPDWFSAILHMKNVDGEWQGPLMVPFPDTHSIKYPFVHPEGNILFFESNRDIYCARKNDAGWTSPTWLSANINTDKREGFVSVARNGNLYFTARYENTNGGFDLYMSEYMNGEYGKTRHLSDSINSEHHEFHSCISPDEGYIVFDSRRPEGLGGNDLYISFRRKDETWTRAKNMGEPINTNMSDSRPYITPDGKYLFFCTTRSTPRLSTKDGTLSYAYFMRKISGPGNGSEDIYWVDSKIIEELKPKELQ